MLKLKDIAHSNEFCYSLYHGFQGIRKLHFQFFRWHRDKRSIIRELAKFTGLPNKTVFENIMEGRKLIADEWKAAAPVSSDEIFNFYKEARNYIWDLANWNYFNSNTYLQFRKIVQNLNSKSNMLDYGAGIGSLLIMAHERKIQNLAYYDVEGYTSEFASYRFRRRRIKINMIKADDDVDFIKGQYGSIVCLEVIEHVADPTIHIKRLLKHLAKGGRLYLSATFGETELYPMHRNIESDSVERLLFDLQKVDAMDDLVVYTKG